MAIMPAKDNTATTLNTRASLIPAGAEHVVSVLLADASVPILSPEVSPFETVLTHVQPLHATEMATNILNMVFNCYSCK